MVVSALARRCSNCGENLIMNLAIEKELRCTIPVCIICYLKAISATHISWSRLISSCMDDWAEEIKEMLKRKRILAVEMEKMDKAIGYEGPIHLGFRN